MTVIAPLAIIVIVALAILLWGRRLALREGPALRPLAGYTALRGQVGRAIESASKLHISLGRASLTGSANPTSVAALAVLDRLAAEGCANDSPPITTVGDGTLLPLAENDLRYAAEAAKSPVGIPPGTARFIASRNDPFAYAAGVASVIQQQKMLGNVMVGHYGQELAIVTEAAGRNQIQQIIGSDDPLALAVAAPVTDNLMIGEEMLAAPAYMQGKPDQIASLQIQDILRILLSLTILGLAVYRFVAG
ncbi:MAG: hypothetical protein H6661_08075 [Ardenticatenaceae bacterium]|nr:hypothetical protein [Ardenticatenaceae bacterium]